VWAAEREVWAADHPVLIPLGPDGVEVELPPMWRWPRTALLALLCDDHETWAALTLDPHEYDRWADVDPTLDDCDDFELAWERATGQSLDTIGHLWSVLDDFPDQLEADLNRHCQGQDLRHLWQEGHGPSRLTWRRLGVLYDGLPGESLTKTAQANNLGEAKLAELAKRPQQGYAPMSGTDMLLAELVDAVNYNTYILRLANTDPKKAKQVRPPEPYPRPGVVRKRSRFRQASPEAARLLAYMRANQGAMPTGWKDVAELPKTG
jgi:hypothetical protein